MTRTTAGTWLKRTALTFMCVCGLWGLSSAFAGKPGGGGGGGGGTTHTSVIAFAYQNAMYEMYEDGSGKTQVLPAGVFGAPSSRIYGTSRWWLTTDLDPVTGFSEIFAFREDGSAVQLTEFGPDGFIVPYPPDGGTDQPRWSNDGLDRFFTVTGDNSTLWRVWVSGDEIAVIEADPTLRKTVADLEFIMGTYSKNYAWSNLDSTFAHQEPDYDGNGAEISQTIWVRILPGTPQNPGGDPLDIPVYTGTKITLKPWSWSHDGSRIAFNQRNTSEWGGVWTIRPDGTGLLRVCTNSGTMNYYHQGWSPNSQELLIGTEKVTIDISKYQYQLVRMPATGGKQISLTSDLVSTRFKTADGRWFAYP